MNNYTQSSLVAILTYNEQSNIEACVKSVNACFFNNIVVLDGGSTDETLQIIKSLSVEQIVKSGSSISERRSMALDLAIERNFEFVLFVDADQRLLDKETQQKANQLFDKEPLLAGIHLNLVTPNEPAHYNYWQMGFYSRHSLITGNFSEKSVIGTPCFFKIDIVKQFKYNHGQINGPSDDTLFCKQITSKNYKLISAPINCTEIVRASFSSTVRKAYWYGIGDAEYIINETNVKNRKNHLFHVLVRNSLINPFKNLNKLFFFYLIFGMGRMSGFLYYYMFRPSKYLNKS